MKTMRLESDEIKEILRMDHNEVNDELAQVTREIAKLTARTHHLENQRDRLYRGDETKPKAGHTDPGPREKFLADTKDMHLSEADRALNTG